MAKWRVGFRQICYTYVIVEVDDDENEDVEMERAIELGYEMAPGQLDAVSSGWNQLTEQGLKWSRELSEELERDRMRELDPIGPPERVMSPNEIA